MSDIQQFESSVTPAQIAASSPAAELAAVQSNLATNPNSVADVPTTPLQQGAGYWAQLLQKSPVVNKIESAYPYLNEMLGGLPSFIINKIPAAKQAFNETIAPAEAANPGIAQASGIAGMIGSLIPENMALKGISAAAKGTKLGALADIARGATPAKGILQGIGYGALQAAPQSALRVATGNMTPQQALLGEALGGGVGAIGGVLGKLGSGAGKAGKAKQAVNETVNDWLLGSSGVRQGDIRPVANFGIPQTAKNARLANARDLTEELSQQIAKNRLYNEPAIDNYVQKTFTEPFNAMDQAWSQAAINGDKMSRYLMDISKSNDPQFAAVKTFSQNHPDNWLNMVSSLTEMADQGTPLPQISKYLQNFPNQAREAAVSGTWAPALDRQASAANELNAAFRDQAANMAENAGLASKSDIQKAFDLYPVRQVLLNQQTRNAIKTAYSAPGSPTFEKYMLGMGLAGGGLAAGQEQNPTPLNILKDLAVGSVAGGLAGPLMSRFANAGISRAAGLAKRGLMAAGEGGAGGGAGGKILSGAAAAAGGPGGVAAAQGAPLAASLFPVAQAQNQQAGIKTTPESYPRPQGTYMDLMKSKDPYLQQIGRQLQNGYIAASFQTDPLTGERFTPKSYTDYVWQQTNGFNPQASVKFLSPDPQTQAALNSDIQTMNQVNSINWPEFDKWFSTIWTGGLSPIRGLVADTLKIPGGAMDAEQQLQALLAKVPGGDRQIAQNQIERIMRERGTAAQKRAKVIGVLMNTHAFAAPGIMQSLGLLK